VFAEGPAPDYGDAVALRSDPVVGIAAVPGGTGYWLATANGGVFSYGGARFYGSAGGVHLKSPIVRIAATPSGNGYWLVAADGGVFSYGGAHFLGSTGSLKLKSPIVAMASTPDGGGYWLAASDGGVFSFGDARFFGSAGGLHLKSAIVGIAASPDSGGYMLASSDGTVFSYGDASFVGASEHGLPPSPVVAVLASPAGDGYWLVTRSGSLLAFGSAGYEGALTRAPPGASVAGAALESEPAEVVTNCQDSGLGSLRQSIATARPGTTVYFHFTRPCNAIALTSGPIVLHSGISIVGPGARALTLSGLDRSQIFDNPRTSASVAISDLSLDNGRTAIGYPKAYGLGGAISNSGELSLIGVILDNDTAAYEGGAISNIGTLSVSGSVFSNDSALFGGALYNNGVLDATDSRFLQDVAPYNATVGSQGGALYDDEYGAAHLVGDQFIGDIARIPVPTPANGEANCCYGGGISNSGSMSIAASVFSGDSGGRGGALINFGQLSVTSSQIKGNTSPDGGGILNATDGSDTANFSDTTISGNTATFGGGGGGLFNYSGQLDIEASTIAGNIASSGDDTGGPGGGIFNGANMIVEGSTVSGNTDPAGVGGVFEGGDLLMSNSTVADNTGGTGGPNGIAVNGGSATVTNSTIDDNKPSSLGVFGQASMSIGATIVAGSGTGNDCQGGPFVDLGWNLADDMTCGFSVGDNDLPPATAPGLDPHGLRDNGGLTDTIALEPSSAAVGFVTNGSLCPLTDQRGDARTFPCDVGAWQGKVPVGSISGTATVEGGGAASGVCVNAFRPGASQPSGNTVTASSGAYTIPDLPTGQYQIQFAPQGCGSGNYFTQWWDDQSAQSSANPVKVVNGKDAGGIDASLQQAGSISGTLTAAGGGPLGGVCIGLFSTTGNGVSGAVTAPNGTYSFPGLLAGTYLVNFNQGQSFCTNTTYVPQWWDNQPTQATATPITVTMGKNTGGIDAALVRGGSISGTVTAGGGGPLGNVCINVFQEGTNSFVTSGNSASNGSYTVGALAAGSYDVEFAPNGCGSGDWVSQWWNDQASENNATAVTVTVGNDTGAVNAALQPGGSISGTVTAAQGGALLGNVCINVFQAGTNNFVTGDNTQSNGTYTISGLAPGGYDVEFAPNGCGSGDWISQWWNDQASENNATAVTVTVGNDTGAVNAALQPGGSISGTVTAAGGGPLGTLCLGLFPAGGGPAIGGVTNSDGSYSFTGLPAGQYQMDFNQGQAFCTYTGYIPQWWNDQSTQATANVITVTVGNNTGGINASLQPGGSISGTVTAAAGGGLLANVCINVFQAGTNNFVTGGNTQSDGTYAVGGLAAGSYDVEFAPSGCGSANWASQWWDNQPTLATASVVTVTIGSDTSGINAALVSN
jgi:hypothetical protein